MLENKQTYRWYVVANLVFGVGVFVISLLSAMTGNRLAAGERQLYFDREMLPDHLFYPVAAAWDQIELQLADPQEQIGVREKLAGKRLAAAEQLYVQGKTELAFVTLGKAHQYLLRVNDDVEHLEDREKMADEVQKLNAEFASEYGNLRIYMTDSQKATATRMTQELEIAGNKLL